MDRLLKQREIEGKTNNANDTNRTQQAPRASQPSVQGSQGTTPNFTMPNERVRGQG